MLILNNPAAVFLGQLHRKVKVGRDPLVVLLHMLALPCRHFIQDRGMPFAHFRPNLLSLNFPFEPRCDMEVLLGVIGQRFEMLHP